MKKDFLSYMLKNRTLLRQLILRDINGRYKGSMLGILWTAINPLMMLSVYTLVFSQVFKARWGGTTTGDETPITFALNLFAGLIVFNIFAECATKSPTLITSNPNFVKKIIFPIHTLGGMITGSACIHGAISAVILVMAKIIWDGKAPLTAALLPIVWLPLIIGCLGMTWILSWIGVIIKDTSQVINAAVSMLMFLSPIFYPTSMLPEKIRWIAAINPLVSSIEGTRSILIAGELPKIGGLITSIFVSLLWCQICFRILKKSQKTLADIL
ncbi:ABC transporter permease [Synechococcus sp. MU1643]|uniref:ABC transporter permease n=1 Tax=Synechococcus sp. MU1643 TaxID=2508349 RepID=UPI001CF809A6|nr:ABC transporter permease [Synechococcus sp. MU1643]MCB4429084.1 ABC transporter permease [Synechococcus sp. MU1643]